MNNARWTRLLTAGSLAVGALLTAVSLLLMPDYSGTTAEWLTASAASNTALVAEVGFTASQLFLAVGFVGLAHLLRQRTLILATLAGALLVLSCFGHTVWGGVGLVTLSMADDPAKVDVYAQLLDQVQAHPVVFSFMATGTVALILGCVLLGVALVRAKLGPSWLGIALIAWVVLEFVGPALGEWVAYAASALFLVVFALLTVLVLRSSLGHWETALEAEAGPELSAASSPASAVRTSSGAAR